MNFSSSVSGGRGRATIIAATLHECHNTNGVDSSDEDHSRRRRKPRFTTDRVRRSTCECQSSHSIVFPCSKTAAAAAVQPSGNLPKLNKIVESGKYARQLLFRFSSTSFAEEEDDEAGEDDENSSTPNTTVLISNGVPTVIDGPSMTSGILRSKDLRSVVETKRRNFSRSQSSSDSEDNGSNFEMNRSSSRKQQARSPTRPSSFQEFSETIGGMTSCASPRPPTHPHRLFR